VKPQKKPLNLRLVGNFQPPADPLDSQKHLMVMFLTVQQWSEEDVDSLQCAI
jgi:hypothetical protein